MGKRCAFSFVISAMCGLIINMLVELIVCMTTGMENFSPITPEYIALFPSERIAVEVYILLYGVIGLAFSAMFFLFECHQIGFLIQNILYFITTGIVWVPITILLWQLHKYPSALIGTLIGYAFTYLVMSLVGYRITKRDVQQINCFLEKQEE